METTIAEIGCELTAFAREEAEYSARGIVGELFPFMLQASKRMSTRAISRWLAESHGVKLSAVSISKALRNPERYWDEYIEMLEPIAMRIESATDFAVEDILTNLDLFQMLDQDPATHFKNPTTPEEYGDDLADLTNALAELNKRWFCLDESTRAKASAAIHRVISGEGNDAAAHGDSEE